MEQRVSCVTLGVTDLTAAAAFYESLGWKRVASSTASIIVFDLLGFSLSLFPKQRLLDDIAAEAPKPASDEDKNPVFSGITLSHNVRTKEEVAPILEKVKQAGGKILKEASSAFWGGWHGVRRYLPILTLSTTVLTYTCRCSTSPTSTDTFGRCASICTLLYARMALSDGMDTKMIHRLKLPVIVRVFLTCLRI